MEHGLARDMGRFRLISSGGMTCWFFFSSGKLFKALYGNEVVGFLMFLSSKSVSLLF